MCCPVCHIFRSRFLSAYGLHGGRNVLFENGVGVEPAVVGRLLYDNDIFVKREIIHNSLYHVGHF